LLDKEKKYYNFILNISEDGWFGRSIGTTQHFVHSQYRAIEQGKHVIRSSNQGISASIKPNGVIDKKTNFISSSSLVVDIYEKNSKTLFSIHENKIFYLLILLTSILVFSFRKINE
jgi:apolipoprotein N-acyltransferase